MDQCTSFFNNDSLSDVTFINFREVRNKNILQNALFLTILNRILLLGLAGFFLTLILYALRDVFAFVKQVMNRIAPIISRVFKWQVSYQLLAIMIQFMLQDNFCYILWLLNNSGFTV